MQGVAVYGSVQVGIGYGDRIDIDDSYDDANLPVDEFEESIPKDRGDPERAVFGGRIEAGINRHRAVSI